jgi:hypothetical protein
MFNKKILKTNNTTSKNFSYSKGNTNLSFNLRTDIKVELKDFLELLKVAQKEVEKEMKAVNAKKTKVLMLCLCFNT